MSISLEVGAFYDDGEAFAGYVQHRALVPNDSIEGPAFLEVRGDGAGSACSISAVETPALGDICSTRAR